MFPRRSLPCIAAALTIALGLTRAAAAGCSVTTSTDKNGLPDMTIQGDLGPQTLVVDAYHDRTVVTLDCDGDGKVDNPGAGDLDHKAYGPISAYTVRMKGGSATSVDSITFNVADTWAGLVRSFNAATGGGNQKVAIGGPGSLKQSSRLVVGIGGAFGNDDVTLQIPAIDASELYLKTDLEAGYNAVHVVNANAITTGAVVEINANLSGAYGGYSFLNTGLVDGTLDVTFDGGVPGDSGPGNDFGSGTIAGQIGAHGRLFLKANLNAGSDGFIGSFATLSIAAGGEVHVAARGGTGNDSLTLSGGSIKNSGLLDVTLEGDDGDDTIYFAPGAITNTGTLRVRLDGGIGNDKITTDIPIGGLSTSTSKMDVVVLGGGGDDTLSYSLTNNGPNQATNYIGAFAIVDGGPGNDTCTTAGNGITHARNCEH